MPTAIETQGTTFGASATGTSPITYTSVLGINSFDGLDGEAATIDVTTLASTSKEYLMGLQDNGNFTLNTNFLPADTGQDLLRTQKNSRALTYFKVTFSDTTYVTFAGYVKSATVSGGVDAKVDGSFSILISGDVTYST
jgi:hypothetical protein